MWSEIYRHPEEAPDRELTLQHAYEMAAGMKSAETQATVLKPATEVTSKLQKLHLNEKKHDGPKCCQCGKTGHSPDKCFYQNAKCHSCQQVGHLNWKCSHKK